MNMNFMATGIIPWNATPGKACGSTLGDICNTSEVRDRLLSTHIHAAGEQERMPWKALWRIITAACLFPVLPVLSPVHRSVRWGRSHRDRPGKPPSDHSIPLPLVHLLHGLYQQIMCQVLLFSFPCGLCNCTKEYYTLAFPQRHKLFYRLLRCTRPCFIF